MVVSRTIPPDLHDTKNRHGEMRRGLARTGPWPLWTHWRRQRIRCPLPMATWPSWYVRLVRSTRTASLLVELVKVVLPGVLRSVVRRCVRPRLALHATSWRWSQPTRAAIDLCHICRYPRRPSWRVGAMLVLTEGRSTVVSVARGCAVAAGEHAGGIVGVWVCVPAVM